MSGTIVIRVPKILHEAIKGASGRAGVSMNSWVSEVLAAQIRAFELGAFLQTAEAPEPERFLENAVQQADGVEIVEDDYPALLQVVAQQPQQKPTGGG